MYIAFLFCILQVMQSSVSEGQCSHDLFAQVIPGTPPTHHAQPLAKKRLSLTPQQVLSPAYSTNQASVTPGHQLMVGGAMEGQGGVMSSPQPMMDNSGEPILCSV